jgi:ABC-type nickel/cobalt efflux system permease component RcnA
MKKLLYRTSVYCVLLTVCTLFLTACGDKKDPKMEEAGKIHLEAMEIEESLHEQVEGIDSLKIVLTDKKKTLTDAAAVASIDSTISALDLVAKSFEEWEESLVEVPGLAHEHHHHEGEEHHHDHKPAPNVSSDQMIEIQKEIKANIEKIKADFTKAEQRLKAVL